MTTSIINEDVEMMMNITSHDLSVKLHSIPFHSLPFQNLVSAPTQSVDVTACNTDIHKTSPGGMLAGSAAAGKASSLRRCLLQPKKKLT